MRRLLYADGGEECENMNTLYVLDVITNGTTGIVTIEIKSLWLDEIRRFDTEPEGLRAVMDTIRMPGLCSLPTSLREHRAIEKRCRRLLKRSSGDALKFVHACLQAMLYGATPHEVGMALSIVRNKERHEQSA